MKVKAFNIRTIEYGIERRNIIKQRKYPLDERHVGSFGVNLQSPGSSVESLIAPIDRDCANSIIMRISKMEGKSGAFYLIPNTLIKASYGTVAM